MSVAGDLIQLTRVLGVESCSRPSLRLVYSHYFAFFKVAAISGASPSIVTLESVSSLSQAALRSFTKAANVDGLFYAW